MIRTYDMIEGWFLLAQEQHGRVRGARKDAVIHWEMFLRNLDESQFRQKLKRQFQRLLRLKQSCLCFNADENHP